MGTRTMGMVVALTSILGAWTPVEAQQRPGPIVAAGPATTSYGPARCRPTRSRARRVDRRCAAPRRAAARYRAIPSGWFAVGWGQGRDVWGYGGEAVLNPGRMKRVMGKDVYGRIRGYGRAMGLRGPVTGTWTGSRHGPVVLNVWMDRYPVAQLVDRDRDGWTDLTLLREVW